MAIEFNNQKHLKIEFKAQFSETDSHSRMRIGAIINILIQSAVKASDKLGFGVKQVAKEDLFWVLSKLNLRIEKEIKWKDKISIETWPKDLDRFFYIRDFIIRDKDNNILARATSSWLLINKKYKRPKIISGMNKDYFNDTRNTNSITEYPITLKKISEGESFHLKTKYFDLDFNKHVTSSRYIDWLMDTFSLEFHKNNYPKQVEINYLKETMSDENIELKREQINNKEYLFEGVNVDKNHVCYRAKISF